LLITKHFSGIWRRGRLSYDYPARFKSFLNLTACRLQWQMFADSHCSEATRRFNEIRGHCMGRNMGRQLNRLSAKAVASTKIPGYVCDGGGLYLQVAASGDRRRHVGASGFHSPTHLQGRDCWGIDRRAPDLQAHAAMSTSGPTCSSPGPSGSM